jgi:hypothetical protein
VCSIYSECGFIFYSGSDQLLRLVRQIWTRSSNNCIRYDQNWDVAKRQAVRFRQYLRITERCDFDLTQWFRSTTRYRFVWNISIWLILVILSLCNSLKNRSFLLGLMNLQKRNETLFPFRCRETSCRMVRSLHEKLLSNNKRCQLSSLSPYCVVDGLNETSTVSLVYPIRNSCLACGCFGNTNSTYFVSETAP